jgi:hypothetical protein
MHPPSVTHDKVFPLLEPLVAVILRNEVTCETKLVQMGYAMTTSTKL